MSRSTRALLLAAAWMTAASPSARAQTITTLDGTSGSSVFSTAYTLSGNTTFGLGFFAEYLIVGGGGAGGSTDGGGGGAGAVLSNYDSTLLQVTGSSNAITVGSGGSRSTVNWTRGGAGVGSSAFGIEALGGGGGGSGSLATLENKTSGGGASSGGLGSTIMDPARLGSASAGNLGGIGASNNGGGGGGGAGTAGQGGSGGSGGNGGFGVQNAITGSAVYYGDGGGGGHGFNTTTGGSGRGGVGNPNGDATGGQSNSGSGGGGGGANFGLGGNGGSGIVVIRYAGDATGITGGSTNTATAPGEAITTFAANGTFGIDLNARLGATLTSAVTGTGDFTFAGPGRLTLAAANTFAGNTRVTLGTLRLGHVDALQNATLDLNAADAGSVVFAVGGDNTYALAGLTGTRNLSLGGNTLAVSVANANGYSGVLDGAGGLTKNGSGTLTLSADNTFTGATVVNAGTLKLTSTSASGSYAIASGGVLEIQVAEGLDTRYWGGTYTGGGTFRKTGTGQIHWFGEADIALDADAVIDVRSGRLQASWGANQIWVNNQSTLNVAAGAEFDVDAAHARFSGLTGDGTVVLGLAGPYALQKLTVGVADATSEFSGVIRDGSGTAPLEKVGIGTLTLSGANTYTGATSVSGGLLAVNGSLASTAVTVQSGATLGGSGTLAGAVTVQSGATLAPGNSPGVLSTGALSVEGLLDIEMAGAARGAAGYDSIQVTGSVTLAATSQLNVSLLGGFQPLAGTLFFLIVNDGTDAVTGTFDGLNQDAVFSLGGMNWQISYVANYTGEDSQLGVSLGTLTGGNDVALVAVPEPSTYGLLLGALALAAAARTRKKLKR